MAMLSDDRALWLAEHVLPHEAALRGWLRGRLALAAQDVDDIVQESYATIAALDDVSHVRDPRGYLYTVARSLVLQHLRRAQIVAFETIAEFDAMPVAGAEPPPEQVASARQQLGRLRELLRALPLRAREAFLLRRVEGLSQREIAQRLGISENTVEKHVGKALRMLMAGMEEEAESGAPGRAQDRRWRRARR